jgi:hypothetical protein
MLAAWVIAVFSLVAGLSVLSLHQRDVHHEGIAAVVPRWYAPLVIGTEDWREVRCDTAIGSCVGELAAAGDRTDLKITQSQGDTASWRSFNNRGRAQELSRC